MSGDGQETEEEVAERWQIEIGEIYDLALIAGSALRMAGFMPVTEAVAAAILAATGSDVSEYLPVVDTHTTRHIMKTHGQPSETDRGQIPLAKDDFLKLLSIITEPDVVQDAGKTKQGLVTVQYTKVVAGEEFFFVQSIEGGSKRLRPVTLYKRKQRP